MTRAFAVYIAILLTFGTSAIANAADKSERTWLSKCASCHGDDGKGQTHMGKQMGVKDFSTSSWQKGITNDGIKVAIEDGVQVAIQDGRPVSKTGLTGPRITASMTTSSQAQKSGNMDAFRNRLKPEEIDGLVKYCRTLAK